MGTTIAPTTTNVGSTGNFIVTWANMANGDVGLPWSAPDWADRNIQVIGTFGSGGRVAMQGSNKAAPDAGTASADYSPLNDAAGVPISVAAAGFAEISEVPYWTRPKVTAGDGSTSVTVIMMVRRTQSGHFK